jgi:hypothetical protein
MRRYQSSTAKVFTTILHRLSSGFWPPGTSRQRAGHWLKKFNNKLKMDFPGFSPVPLLARLYAKGLDFLM